MGGYIIVFRQLDFIIVAGIINVKSTLGFRVERLKGLWCLSAEAANSREENGLECFASMRAAQLLSDCRGARRKTQLPSHV